MNKGSKCIFYCIVTLVLFNLPTAYSQSIKLPEDIAGFVEKVLSRYKALDSYCDTLVYDGDARYNIDIKRCYVLEGAQYKVKTVDTTKYRRTSINWGDSVESFRLQGRTDGTSFTFKFRYYEEKKLKPLSSRRKMLLNEEFVKKVLLKFNGGTELMKTRKTFNNEKHGFRINEALSDDGFTVLEYFQNFQKQKFPEISRMFVSNRDMLIKRTELYRAGKLSSATDVISVKTNAQLIEEDLTYQTPFSIKYSFSNKPYLFTAAVSLITFLLGLLLCVFRFSKIKGEEYVRSVSEFKRISKKVYIKTLLMVLVLFGVLLILSFIGGGGHPPLFIYVFLGARHALSGAVIYGALVLGITVHRKQPKMELRTLS